MDWHQLAALLVVGAFVYFGGRLAYSVAGSVIAVRRATRDGVAALDREIASLSSDDLRHRLLQDGYLRDLRTSRPVQAWLDRVAAGDEVALVRDYSRASLYRMLSRAEYESGATGRPEAVDAVGWIWPYLEVLAERRRGEAVTPERSEDHQTRN
jgi:hypothetical protein